MKFKPLAAGLIMAAGMLVSVGPASAALSDCPSNYMCMWGNNDFKWMIGKRFHGNETIANLSGDANDEMDSWANRSATHIGCMFEHAGGGGARQTMAKVSSDNNVAPWHSDEITSWRTKNGC